MIKYLERQETREIRINRVTTEHVNSFKYLGETIETNGNVDKEINEMIKKSETIFSMQVNVNRK